VTRKRYKEALKGAGVRAVRFHDLLHTFGTRCAAQGVPMRMLQERMGTATSKRRRSTPTTRRVPTRPTSLSARSPPQKTTMKRRIHPPPTERRAPSPTALATPKRWAPRWN